MGGHLALRASVVACTDGEAVALRMLDSLAVLAYRGLGDSDVKTSVIVPVLYTEPQLGSTLRKLAVLRDQLDLEIVLVVDVPNPEREVEARSANRQSSEEVGAVELYRIPDLLRKSLVGQRPIPLLGDGSSTRSFTFVDDVGNAIVTVGLHPNGTGEDFNIGTGVETSIMDLPSVLWAAMGNDGVPDVVTSEPLAVDVGRRVPDVSNIQDRLGWSAAVSLDEGILQTVDWYPEQPKLTLAGRTE